jgi:membrane protein implicated in regulation of membrane protease activity
MADISCPACGQIDRVEKITVAANLGTPLGRSLYPISPNRPVRKPVALPPAPASPTPVVQDADEGEMLGCGIFLIAGIVAGGIAWVLGLNGNDNTATVLIFWVCVIVIIIVVVTAITRRERSDKSAYSQQVLRYEQERKEIMEKEAREYVRALGEFYRKEQQYEDAEIIWRQLYYCYRDDGAFLPDGRSPLIPRNEIKSFCGFP